jgi:hypothetical protein
VQSSYLLLCLVKRGNITLLYSGIGDFVKEKLKKLNEYEWLLPKGSRERMNVDAKIISNKKLLDAMEDAAVEQLTNVATLPGVVSPVVGLPDMHWGFVFSEN